ncbi:hypothetical protein BRX37_23985 [Sphingomonas sp. S-NIH.Pt3_0716]|nr:hypothetical protein BRX37_23985 [Sphingomonas sp. S-NIH.Pt3_0716]
MKLVRREAEFQQARFDWLSAHPLAHPINPPVFADLKEREDWSKEMDLPHHIEFSQHIPFMIFETLEDSAVYRLRWGDPS